MADGLRNRIERLEQMHKATPAIPPHIEILIQRDIRAVLGDDSANKAFSLQLADLSDDELLAIEAVYRRHTGRV